MNPATTESPRTRPSGTDRASARRRRAATSRRRAAAETRASPRRARRRRRTGAAEPASPGAETARDLRQLAGSLQWSRPSRPAAKRAARVPFRRLHILMVGWEFPPNHTGGLGVHCYELCKEITRMGHRVTFLTPFTGPFSEVPGVVFRHPGDDLDQSESREAGETWYPHAYWSGEAQGSPFPNAMDGYNAWIRSLDRFEDVDIIHVHDWFGTVGAAALAKRIRRPLVMTVHSTEYDRSVGHPWPYILEREEVGIQTADRIIAVSRHLRQQLIDRYSAKASRVRVVYNAVRPSDRLAPLEDSREIVLYLGRLAAMKGVDTFLRAAARLAPEFPEALFVVAGEGPEFPHLLTLAAHLGISDQTLFLGRVTEEERAVLLAGASVFVLPSVVEPFGIAALEAMAAGVPAIVSRTSGAAEITESVFAVDFWDTDEFASRVAELLRYPVLRRQMGEHGRWEALREGWPERAMETVGVYTELLRPTARSSS